MSYYCLKCRKQNNCKCSNSDFRFAISDKLRVPDTSNKAKFRKFLEDCPIFPNCVLERLQEEFRKLLREVKFFNTVINGHKWTEVKNEDFQSI